MKKWMSLLLALVLVFALVSCNKADNNTTDTEANQTEDQQEDTTNEDVAGPDTEKGEGVMTYAEYIAADLETEVTIEAYVQANQSWWDNTITLYTQDADGAYFIYGCACSEEDAALLVPGTKIKVTGYKSEWSGEVEIVDGSFEILEGNWIAPATDVTEQLASESLVDMQNMYVSFTGMTVEAANEAGDAFMYNWDGSGSEGDDLYFNVSYNGNTYTFTVESYLTGAGTEVYTTVQNLQVGDTVVMEGFLYWYEGVNPHITSVVVK